MTDKHVLTAIRQINLALWTMYVWGRDANNLEAAYLSAERAVLSSWAVCSSRLDGRGQVKVGLRDAMTNLIGLYVSIGENLIVDRITPHANKFHGLSTAVRSASSLDVNLKMFDLMGRVALHGLCLVQLTRALEEAGAPVESRADLETRVQRNQDTLIGMINANPALVTPIADHQAIDVNLACIFLAARRDFRSIAEWTAQIAAATVFAYRTNGKYPTIFSDYRDLIDHPKADDRYRTEATAGSILVPTLAGWSAMVGRVDTLQGLRDFSSDDYAHSTLQLIFPGSDTEDHIYAGQQAHGIAATGLQIQVDPQKMLEPIQTECNATDHFWRLSAIQRGQWMIVLMACRHHRQPVPPQFWQDGVIAGRASASTTGASH